MFSLLFSLLYNIFVEITSIFTVHIILTDSYIYDIIFYEMTQVSWYVTTNFRMPQGGIIMKWRQISICPTTMRGDLKTPRVYSCQDLLDFCLKERKKSDKQYGSYILGAFNRLNAQLFRDLHRLNQPPVADPNVFGKLWVPVNDDEQEKQTETAE